MTEEIEEWRPVVGWEGRYEVSSLGRVRSLYFGPKIMSPNYDRHGYLGLGLHNTAEGRKTIRVKVAKLVAEAFLGPRPEGHHVCHNNGIRDDDKLSNLRYDTISGNMRDKEKHGTASPIETRGPQHPFSKLTINDVEWMFAAMEHGMLRKEIAERLQITSAHVSEILNGTKWRATLKDKPWYKPQYSSLPGRKPNVI